MLRELISDATPAAKVSLKMLVWLAFTQSGLTLGQLQAAVADDPNHLAVLNGTNSLKRLDYFLQSKQGAQGNDTIHITRVHMGWYLRRWLCDKEGIHTDGPDALIAERCLSYISSVFNLTDLPEDDGELDSWAGRYPLLRYAGSNWATHARNVKSPSDQHTGLIESLLESRHVERVFRKTFDLASDAQGQVQKYLLSEWQILFKLRHPHIVRYIDSDEDPYHNEFLLYLEYCDKGDVESFHGIQLKDLRARANKRYGFVEDETRSNLRPLSGVEIWAMIWQMSSALAYLHYGLSIKRENGRYGASLEGQ
ncbi:hypothetical protein NW754_004690 [Fusarium falciforme]|nr:hypothetical protein NW754_004690 [Fusarium falciforme]